MRDNEIIHQIILGGYPMEKCLELFYKENFGYLGIMGKKYGLDREALLDAYSDSIIAFRDHVRNNQFKQKSKCSTYFYSIFNNKCIDILRKKTTYIVTHEIPENLKDTTPDIIQALTFSVEKDYLTGLMTRLGSRCREILMDWNDGYSMEDIAIRNHLLNAKVARSKRYSCLQQLLELAGGSKSGSEKEVDTP
jgi:RNA polymerase sigma-70 factor (ECF subfamily)